MQRRVESQSYLNHGRVLRLSAMRYHDRPALEFEGRVTSFVDLNEQVNAMAHALADHDVSVGDRVVLVAPNGPDYVRVMFAAAKLGAVTVPTNTGLLTPDLAHIVRASRPRVIVAGEAYLDRANEAVGLAGPEATPEVLRLLPDSTLLDRAPDAGTLALVGHSVAEPPAPGTSDADTAVLLFTSGSMGTPKAVAKSFGNVTWHALNRQISQPRWEGDRELVVVPLTGVGFGNFLLTDIMVGATCVLEPRFDAQRTATLLRGGDIHVAFLAPTMLLAVEGVDPQAEFPSVRVLETAYEVTPDQRKRIAAMVPSAQILYSYGCTEGSMARAPAEAFLSDITNVGYASGLDQYRVLADGAEPAEIEVSGPTVMQGYLRDDGRIDGGDIHEGWFPTGDLGTQDECGAIHFAGRAKDMIKSGGLNVFASDVESALAGHDAVSAVAVVGVPDDYWGEAVVAVLELAAGARTAGLESSLREHARETLAGYKRPKAYLRVDRLPFNSGGKLAKSEVRSMIEKGLARPLADSEPTPVE